MCDYSLESQASRPAAAGARLVSATFPRSTTRGFCAVVDRRVAVCLTPDANYFRPAIMTAASILQQPDAPKLAFSGAVYSSNPAQRMLIVNGQVVHEGADLGAGVVLEEIKPKAAVVRFRGGRYQVGL